MFGNVVGYNPIDSASKMNNTIVVFFKLIDKAHEVVQTEVIIDVLSTTS